MLKKIYKIILSKKFFSKNNKGVMWSKIPTDLVTLAEREEFTEATNKLEKII